MNPVVGFPPDIEATATAVLAAARARGVMVATAESCTGGLIAAALTAIPGSSDVVDRGFVTYTNAAKTDLVGVPAELIDRVGAVSEAVARAMAEGAVAASRAALAVAVTGVAGPGGGSAEKPVGLVHLAVAIRGGATRHLVRRYGDIGRDAVRAETLRDALGLLRDALAEPR
ncbi:CinA family protein [Methylobrevis albus]|uniref:CinA family protein n=1 Tax=Methylobrevis albus TaxID=2793297 RepID=A0A931N1L9_9HYPH|nr:CinA family protein [Methylobrevis albus]MBH0239966.1 CinA family protein [Methylobrevis albus]